MTRIELFHAKNEVDSMLLDTVKTELEFPIFIGARIEHEGKTYSLIAYPGKLALTVKESNE